jgi:benzoate/toluate 1,2-dioxygenase subunit beta
MAEGDGMSTALEPAVSLRERVSAFLAYEADLADRHRYREWLALWATDAIYWVPANEDDYDVRRHVSIIYDDHERLTERCLRLSADGVHSQDPPSRLCRLVGNIQITREPAEDGVLDVAATMMLVEVRFGVKTVYGARLGYQLRQVDGGFSIKQKKVVLVDNDEPLGNLTFLL